MPSHPNPLPPSSQSIPKRKKEIKKTKPQKEIKKNSSTHTSPAAHHIELSSLDTSHIQVSNVSLCAA